MSTDKTTRCSVEVHRGSGFGYRSRCSNLAVVEREIPRTVYPPATKVYNEDTFTFSAEIPGKPETVMELKAFCATHDPVRQAERENKKREQEAKERSRDEQIAEQKKAESAANLARVSAIIRQLGVGRPNTFRSDWRVGEFTTLNVILTANEADALVEKLGRLAEYEAR